MKKENQKKRNKSRKLKALLRASGIIKNLPKKNYAQTIDKVLYGNLRIKDVSNK